MIMTLTNLIIGEECMQLRLQRLITDGFESKDISDFHRDFGKTVTKELIKELIENGKQV